jgi:hypothetical protein
MLRSRNAVAALILVLSSTSLLLVATTAAADEDHSALRGLQTTTSGYTHGSTTKRCPSNQRYLSNVQFGCPASCDQPVPMCKASVGPGCGCPKGTVLAGSSRPHNRKRCIQLQRCKKKPVSTPTYVPSYAPPPLPSSPFCPNNATPLADPYCGRGGTPCPIGYRCNIDPANPFGFAVCCPDANYVTPLANVYCGRGGTPCPVGYGCVIDPANPYAVCCREKDNDGPSLAPLVVPPAPSAPPRCVVKGCNGEICTDNDQISTLCVVPSCAEKCIARWGYCVLDSYTGTCGWTLSPSNAGLFKQCVTDC